jgi:GntR family transcriptional regulator, arabinose operon transcriptional repressor
MEREIETRGLPPNSMFMTENEAIERYKVSRITVRQAFNLLEEDGLIYRVQGKGCFVAPHDARPTKSVAFLGTCIVTNGVESVLLRAIEEYVDHHNYNMLICNTNNDFNRAERYLQRLIKTKIDAIIYAGILSDTDYEKNAQFIRYMQNNGIWCVQLDRYIPSIPSDQVFAITPDNFQGGYRITEHLVSLGHTRIGFCGGVNNSSQWDRIAGYQQCLRDHGVEPDNNLIRRSVTEDDMPVVARRFMMIKDRPTAIFVICDEMAYRLIDSFNTQGVKVPSDMAVVGFDDFAMNSRRSIGLTTMHVPLWEEGVLAASVVVDLLQGRQITPSHIKVPCNLVIRESCGARSDGMGNETPLEYASQIQQISVH